MSNTGVDTSGISRVLADSDANKTAVLLADLLFYIGQAARGAYPQAGTSPIASADQLRGYNEMVLIIASELQSLLRDAGARRSGDDFCGALVHWAHLVDCEEGLQWALDKTIGSTRQ